VVAGGVRHRVGGSGVAPRLAVIDTMHRRGRAISMAHSSAFLNRPPPLRLLAEADAGTTTSPALSPSHQLGASRTTNLRTPPRSPAGWLSQRFPISPGPRPHHHLQASNHDTPEGSSPHLRAVHGPNRKRNIALPITPSQPDLRHYHPSATGVSGSSGAEKEEPMERRGNTT
jgi:hypothetical protein